MGIDLLEIGLVGQIAMHRMARTEAMIGMVVHEGAMIGMVEVEGHRAMIGATRAGQDHMTTALAEEDALLPLSATNC